MGIAAVLVAASLPAVAPPAAQADHASSAVEHTLNIERVAQMPMSQYPRAGMAFQDDLIVIGVRYGFTLARILPRPPFLEPISTFACPMGEWGDVSIWGDYVFMSVEDATPYGEIRYYETDFQTDDCNNTDFSKDRGGIRIVDISNPRWPRQIKFVELPGGSANHVLVPHRGKLLIYSLMPPGDTDTGNATKVTTRFTIMEFDPARPRRVIEASSPNAFPSYGCFDMTVMLSPQPLAACVMWGGTWLFDLSDPFNPRLLSRIDAPVSPPNIVNATAHWTSAAQFTWDGRYLAVADTADFFFNQNRGSPCLGGDDRVGVVWFYDISDPRNPQEAGHFALPHMAGVAARSGPCSAMSVSVLPMKDPRRYVATVTWLAGGMDVVDFTDPARPREIAYWNAGDGPMSSFWHNGRIYAGIGLTANFNALEGFEVKGLDGSRVRYFDGRYNPNTQVARFRPPAGWLAAAGRRTARSLHAKGPPPGGGHQTTKGSLVLRDQAVGVLGADYCGNLIPKAIGMRGEPFRSTANGKMTYIFDVKRSTWGEPFRLDIVEGHPDVDLDMAFTVGWGSKPHAKYHLEWVDADRPGGERGIVPRHVRHAFVCIARGEQIDVPGGSSTTSPIQRASFVYRAGRR